MFDVRIFVNLNCPYDRCKSALSHSIIVHETLGNCFRSSLSSGNSFFFNTGTDEYGAISVGKTKGIVPNRVYGYIWILIYVKFVLTG